MATRDYSEEQILAILEEADRGASPTELCQEYGLTPATFDAWRQKYSDPVTLRSALRRKNRQLNETQVVAGLGSWELDLATKKAEWTPNQYVLMGYEAGGVEAVPKSFLDRIHDDDKDRVRKELDRPFEDQNSDYEAEFRLVMPDGQIRHVAERGRVIKDGAGKPVRYVGTTLDITERKTAEAARQELWEQFSQAQKMESIGRFAGGVAHDFNNMLTVILGHTELLMAQLSTEDAVRQPIEGIAEAANRSSELIRQLMTISRKQAIDAKTIELPLLIDGMLSILRRLMGEDILVRAAHDDGLRKISADPGQIEQVFLNLAVNARDAMPQGGEFTIASSNVTLDKAYCEEHVEAEPGNYVMLTVSDSGCGMTAETRDRIFEPFFTTKPPDKGTGLGLATVFGIVSQNGGRIAVSSELDEGTTFEIFFPAIA